MDAKSPPKIDRLSPIPVYQQIASDLVNRISLGEWQVGEKLPSEVKLTNEYMASRVTIRQATALLEDEGLITRQRGSGIFLKSNPQQFIRELYLPQVGYHPVTDITCSEFRFSMTTDAKLPITKFFGLQPEAPLVLLERSFRLHDKILGYNHSWFPADRLPGMADQPLLHNSVTETLSQRYGIRYRSVENYVEALLLDAPMSCLLDTNSPAPGLKVTSLYTAEDGSPITYSITLWNGHGMKYHVNAP